MNPEQVQHIMNSLLDTLTDEQKTKLQEASAKISNPEAMNPEQVLELFKDIGINVDDMVKSARRADAERRQARPRVKIGRNEKCPCKSGKKYKKCCGFMA